MKKVILFAASLFVFASCGSDSTTTTTTTETHTHTHEDGTVHDANHQEVASTEAAGPKDPICDMVKGADWTEFSVNAATNDTTWFCSPVCKETFDKDPAKYAVK